jgi:hypothetical protein
VIYLLVVICYVAIAAIVRALFYNNFMTPRVFTCDRVTPCLLTSGGRRSDGTYQVTAVLDHYTRYPCPQDVSNCIDGTAHFRYNVSRGGYDYTPWGRADTLFNSTDPLCKEVRECVVWGSGLVEGNSSSQNPSSSSSLSPPIVGFRDKSGVQYLF